jgi:hypothetical protein
LTQVSISTKPLNTTFTFDEGSMLRVGPTEHAEPDDPLWHLYSGRRTLVLLAAGEMQYGLLSRNAPHRCRAQALLYAAYPSLNPDASPAALTRRPLGAG